MARPLQHSTVVIVGASSGIGRATALAFARHGSSLVLGSRRPLLLSDLAAECQRLGSKALAVVADAADEHGLSALAHKTVETFGRLDVWFNNAGVGVFGRLEDVPPEALHRAMETNLMSCLYGARAALPHFRKEGQGVLINNSCLIPDQAPDLMTPYTVAKWGVRGLGVALRRELAGTGIHVCTLLGGPADTAFVEAAANFTGRQAQQARHALPAEDVAEAVVRCAGRPRAEIVVPGHNGTPELNRHHMEHHEGTLFEPAPDVHLA